MLNLRAHFNFTLQKKSCQNLSPFSSFSLILTFFIKRSIIIIVSECSGKKEISFLLLLKSQAKSPEISQGFLLFDHLYSSLTSTLTFFSFSCLTFGITIFKIPFLKIASTLFSSTATGKRTILSKLSFLISFRQ